MTVTSQASRLRDVQPFADLPESELLRLDTVGTVRALEAGAVLVQAGESVDSAFILVEGSLSEERGDGTALHQGPGPVLVPSALLSARPCDHTVRAVTAAVAIALPRQAFDTLLEEQSRLGEVILRRVTELLVQRVRLLNQRLNELMG